ncbi:LysM peptidoglycan-binding domain-containing C40 family peptidase [Arthrobacter crystallopoietes]|uniref:NlpC/P60 family protein n=1 Tax=Crystallibacter crystallopoietes TaxID=37928 RepID=UPI003D25D2AE
MFTNNSARHRATPARNFLISEATKSVSANAGKVGRGAAVVTAGAGLMLGAGMPAANAAGSAPDHSAAYVAPAGAAEAAATEAPATSHTVKPGDTLGAIASQHGVALEDVFAANGLGMDSVIYPGDVIALSGAAAAPAAPAPAAEAPAAEAPAPQVEAAPAGSMNVSLASAEISPASATSGLAGIAKSMVGTPYVWGGNTPAGWDCSGFTKWVYAQAGIDLPRTSQAQAAALTPTSNPKPGDLVSQNGGSHIGIYLGGGKMVSALNPGDGTLVHPTSWMSVDGYYTAG